MIKTAIGRLLDPTTCVTECNNNKQITQTLFTFFHPSQKLTFLHFSAGRRTRHACVLPAVTYMVLGKIGNCLWPPLLGGLGFLYGTIFFFFSLKPLPYSVYYMNKIFNWYYTYQLLIVIILTHCVDRQKVDKYQMKVCRSTADEPI